MKAVLARARTIYRNSSISQKLFIAFSLMIAIPAIIVSFLFIRLQETQLYNEAMAAGSSHVSRLNDQLRSRMNMLESASSLALSQRAFVDFIHSDMREDGLRLVKFKQNQYELMHHIVQSHEFIGELSFYVDNPDLYEIWPEIYHYDRFEPQEYWADLREAGGAAFRLFSHRDGDSTLSYYRLVRLQSQPEKRPTIMEIRSPHQLFFRDVLEGAEGDFFSVIMDEANPDAYVYDAIHPFVQNAGEDLERILSSVHLELNALPQQHPVEVKVKDQAYYALYRYIAPLNAYVVDIVAHDVLMKGPRNWYALVLAITGAVLLVMLLLVSHTTRRIFRRLDRVLASMRKVRRGKLDAKIDTGLHAGETGDEIDEVAVSYNNMLDEIQRLMTQVVDKQLIAKNAQLHSLHSQINSHFLYNALESIRMLAEVQRQGVIADALVSLGSLMRYSMRWQGDTVALREELANIESYIRFINFMEGDGFELVSDIPAEMLGMSIPKMCLQPIVENVVHHAATVRGKVHIQISARLKNERQLQIEIRDNGAGIEKTLLDDLQAALLDGSDTPIVAGKNGLGLENVHKRLQLLYGQSYGLWIESVQGVFTSVTITLPWEKLNLGGW